MIAIVEMRGPPRERGRAAGEAMRDKIQGHLAAWLGAIPDDGEAQARALLADTDFRPAIERHCPGLLEEVAGMAQGAGVDPDLLFALQLLDEEWAFRGRQLRKCSSLAVVTDGPTWIGQNMDLGTYTDGYQALLRIEPGEGAPAALVFTVAGMVGLMGVNAAGVALCVNSLPQLPSVRTGVPVAFVVRRLLQARSLAEAADLVQTLPHATNQHYLIAEAGAARSFEACAEWVEEFRPADPGRIFHTNHPLTEKQGRPETEGERANSVARLASVQGRLSSGKVGLAEAQAALSSSDDPNNPVSRLADIAGGAIGFTTGSIVSALERGQPVRSWLSAGPPSVRGYAEVAVAEAALA